VIEGKGVRFLFLRVEMVPGTILFSVMGRARRVGAREMVPGTCEKIDFGHVIHNVTH
jgi:hypothetical protein